MEQQADRKHIDQDWCNDNNDVFHTTTIGDIMATLNEWRSEVECIRNLDIRNKFISSTPVAVETNCLMSLYVMGYISNR